MDLAAKRKNIRPLIIKEDYIIVPLTQGKLSIIDRKDENIVKGRNWFAMLDNGGSYYAGCNIKLDNKWTHRYMHRVIMNPPEDQVIDHINHDTLDNRRFNLRVSSHKENLRNNKRYANNKSGYKGVCWHKRSCRWVAQIRCDGKAKNIGYFNSAEDAAKAYDAYARLYYGEFASLNFPEDLS